jgi:DNA recombination protein RmuC
MEFAAGLVVGLLLGVAMAWALLRRATARERDTLLQQTREQMRDIFGATAIEALDANTQRLDERSESRLESKKALIDQALKNVSDRIKELGDYSKTLEASRKEAYGGLRQQVEGLVTAQQDLRKVAGNLATALRAPKVRGRWGEIGLRNAADMAGMTEYCDYAMEVTVDSDEGRQRPDMVVRLPGGGQIIVDAKVPMDAFLNAIEAEKPEDRSGFLSQHAQQVRVQMQKLSEKAYWSQFERAPEFVVMFIPGESFFSAALEADPKLLEDGMKRRVVLATPSTLMALLRIVAFGWREESIAENAKKISDLGKELYDRIRIFTSHFVTAGRAIKNAMDSYNKSVGSLESRVLSSARKFRELGATGSEDIPSVEKVDSSLRDLSADASGEEKEE